MDRAPLHGDPPRDRSSPRQDRPRPQLRGIRALPVIAGDVLVLAVLENAEMGIVCLAQPARRIADRIEHRLQLVGRARDDAENLARRRLILQRLRDLLRAGLHLLEEADVVDGDDGLVGESLYEVDLPLGEGTDLTPHERHGTNRFTLPQQRHAEHRPCVRCMRLPRRLQPGCAQAILDVNRALLHDAAAGQRSTTHGDRIGSQISDRFGVRIVRRRQYEGAILDPPDVCPIGLTKARSGDGNGVEHRLHIGRGA